MEVVNGIIREVHPEGLVVWVPYRNIDRVCRRQYSEVQVGLEDGRLITPEQQRKAYALMGEIGEWCGCTKDEVKGIMKHQFVSEHVEGLRRELFSLANCDVTTAKEYISYLIDFILQNGVPTHTPLRDLADDIDRYVYACLIRKACAVCQRPAEFHHIDTVGMGNNRNKVNHIGRECLPLCREHHTEIHTMPVQAFLDKYHLKVGICDEKIAKVYKLRGGAKRG